jgi:hypothetical protein
VGQLQPGDRVRTIDPPGNARIISCRPSERTAVKARKAAPNDPPAVGLIVVFEMMEGHYCGRRFHNILHPNDEVKL